MSTNHSPSALSPAQEAAAADQATRIAALIPPGHQLCPCVPLVLVLDHPEGVTLVGHAVARHAGLPVPPERRRSDVMPHVGEFAGVIAHAEFNVSVELSGRSCFPRLDKLSSRRPRPISFTEHDTALLRPLGKAGRVLLRPFVRSR